MLRFSFQAFAFMCFVERFETTISHQMCVGVRENFKSVKFHQPFGWKLRCKDQRASKSKLPSSIAARPLEEVGRGEGSSSRINNHTSPFSSSIGGDRNRKIIILNEGKNCCKEVMKAITREGSHHL